MQKYYGKIMLLCHSDLAVMESRSLLQSACDVACLHSAAIVLRAIICHVSVSLSVKKFAISMAVEQLEAMTMAPATAEEEAPTGHGSGEDELEKDLATELEKLTDTEKPLAEEKKKPPPRGLKRHKALSEGNVGSSNVDGKPSTKLRREASVGSACILLQQTKGGEQTTRLVSMDAISSLVPAAMNIPEAAAKQQMREQLLRIQRGSSCALKMLKENNPEEARRIANLFLGPVKEHAQSGSWTCVGVEKQTFKKAVPDILDAHPLLALVKEVLQKYIQEAYKDREDDPYPEEVVAEVLEKTEEYVDATVQALEKHVEDLAESDPIWRDLSPTWRRVLLAWQLQLALTQGKHRNSIKRAVTHEVESVVAGMEHPDTLTKQDKSIMQIDYLLRALCVEISKISLQPKQSEPRKQSKKVKSETKKKSFKEKKPSGKKSGARRKWIGIVEHVDRAGR